MTFCGVVPVLGFRVPSLTQFVLTPFLCQLMVYINVSRQLLWPLTATRKSVPNEIGLVWSFMKGRAKPSVYTSKKPVCDASADHKGQETFHAHCTSVSLVAAAFSLPWFVSSIFGFLLFSSPLSFNSSFDDVWRIDYSLCFGFPCRRWDFWTSKIGYIVWK